MINIDKLNDWEKQALITYMLSKLNEETRTELKHTLPMVYNKIVGSDVMEVTQRKTDAPNKRAMNGAVPSNV